MIKVSLIIPVYNAEAYLTETLNCVCEQSLQEIEVILVDDGSNDKSGEICDQFVQKDSRFQVFHQDNKGMCASRNFAMTIARGEYIGFADNDDVFEKDFLKDNYELASENAADAVKFGRKCVYVNELNQVVGEETRQFGKRILDHQQIIKDYYKLQQKGILSGVWDGLYKKELIIDNQVRFHEDFRYGCEDKLFNREMVPFMKKLVLNDKCYYSHIIRQNYSASAQFNDTALDRHRKACAIEAGIWEKLHINNWGDGQREQGIANEYLIPALFMLCDKNCNYSFKKKKIYLDKMYNTRGFDMRLSRKKMRNIWKLNKRRAIVIYLFYKKNYRSLLFTAAQYKKVINRRLNKSVRA